MDPAQLKDGITELRDCIERDVASGFSSPHEIIEHALEMVANDYDAGELRPHAERLVCEAVEARRAAERLWPRVTDCDRLAAAFAALERDVALVCRENFSCCGACGAGEIRLEIEQERQTGREICGYVFYHMQDTENAIDGYGLFLHYGSVLRGPKAAAAVGQQLVAALRRAGLQVNWDGNPQRRIGVRFDWKRRLPPVTADSR
jgi:hypothetical protein